MKIEIPIEVQEGKIIMDRERLRKQLEGKSFKGHIVIADKPIPKTLDQLGAFFAAVLPQIQKHRMDNDGIFIHDDKIRHWLKQKFLTPVKRYYSDGSPVMVDIPHPERKGVRFSWHLEEIPSMSELTKEQMSSFMSEIIYYFWHEEGLKIEIKQ